MRHKRLAPSFIAALVIGAASHAQAVPVTFNFDSVASHDNVAEGNGLGKTGGNTDIATNMNGVLDAASGLGTSTVSVSGALATSTYNGESHVNGDTLGTSNGGVHDAPAYTDQFIMNDDFGIYGSATDRFSFTFTGFYIYSVSFDWEIFPDASCPASTSSTACANNPSNSNYPDIALLADEARSANAHPAASAAAAAEHANAAAGFKRSSRTPPSTFPTPMPLTIKVADHVNASVAYRAGAYDEISSVTMVSDGAMQSPARNATSASQPAEVITACATSGSTSTPSTRRSCRSCASATFSPP